MVKLRFGASCRGKLTGLFLGSGRKYLLFILLILSAIFPSACDMQLPLKPTITPMPDLTGVLLPWSPDVPVAGRRITLCRILGQPHEGRCILADTAVTTDVMGHFELGGYQSGTYFIMYDSGQGDFNGTVAEWGGRELSIGNRYWLSEFLGTDVEKEGVQFMVPDGISSSPHEGWLSHYCILTLSVSGSPFIIAHDMEIAHTDRALRIMLANVEPGRPLHIDFYSAFFGES